MNDNLNLVKELRDKTGAGFLDCKKALSENKNDISLAIDYLRKKGLAKASKKSSREANEGVVAAYSNEAFTVLLKINTETDFAAKSETFLDFVDQIGSFALKSSDSGSDKKKFLNESFHNKTINDYFTEMIAKIGENLILSDIIYLSNEDSLSNFYVHNSYRNNIGKIISAIKYKSFDNNKDELSSVSKNICMHIAAMKPLSLNIDDLNDDLINKEKEIQKDLILSSGKPQNMVDKILDGKMRKFYNEVTLLNQNFVLDPNITVKEYLKNNNLNILSFRTLSL
ncbi:translation elongation factor Ts [Pelagibacteraceae bacterium]|nr:translation elongation factor Ts [Pelagibacteraceae bacterium]